MKIYIDIFILGLTLGWGPCLSFCAPILLPYVAGTQKNWLGGLKVSLVFSLARIVSYVILSLISATLGQYLIHRFYEGAKSAIIYIAAGTFITLLGIFILIGKNIPHYRHCEPRRGEAISKKEIASSPNIETKGLLAMTGMGLLVGFAPCAPLLGLLTYIAFNAQNFLQGAFMGLTFGLGTAISPLILFGPLSGLTASLLLNRPRIYHIFTRACGLILVYLGIGMIMRILRAI